MQDFKTFKEFNNAIRNCHKCSLCDDKNNKVVIGRGGEQIKVPLDLLIISEASGADEAKAGLPYQGRAGKVFDNWIKLININNWMAVNTVKNRPVDENGKNRAPTDEEIKACSFWLFKQIELYRPKKILCLGNIALHTVTGTEDGILTAVKNKKEYLYNGIKVYTFLHPAYVLRNANYPWQEEIEELAGRLTGKKVESASTLWSTSGVKASVLAKELNALQKEDDELSYPLIGLRTEYSLMNFGGKLEDEEKFLIRHGAKVISVCDDNSTSSFMKVKNFLDYGIKVIYGSKVSYGNYRLSLLVENQQGYINLNKIVSAINMEEIQDESGFIRLISANSEGLVLIIPSADYNVNLDYTNIIQAFKRAYAGICSDSLANKIKGSQMVFTYGLKPIIYQNNYYTSKEDYPLYLTIKSIKNHSKMNETRIRDRLDNNHILFLSEIKYDEKLFNNTQELADSINYEFVKYHNLLPDLDYKYEDEAKIDEYIKQNNVDRHRAVKELTFLDLLNKVDLSKNIEQYARMKGISVEESRRIYDERLKSELEVIFGRNFVDYFLIIKDIYDYARKENRVVGVGRGSVGGSLAGYMLKIIQIDPLQNNLIFERFINIDRIDLPDIDCDFGSSFREDIIKYLVNKYGKERIIHCGTILSFKEKSAINEVGKVFDIPKYITEEINGMIIKRTSGDARSGMIIHDTIETFPQFRKYVEKYPDFFKMLEKVEGQKRTFGTHASGIIIFKDDFYNYVSLVSGSKGAVTCFEYPEMEHNGLVKLDLLGLSAIDMIERIAKKNNVSVNYSDPANNGSGLTDSRVFELIKNKQTAGMFQVSTPAMTRIGSGFVENFTDIIALNGICRPAPLRYGVPQKYEQFKKTGKLFSIGSELADEMLKGYGFEEFGNLILFQEQIMVIFNKVGGFYASHSNSAIKAISKSKGISTFFEQYGQKFIDGAKKNGIPEEDAKKIFDNIYQFGSFCYNLSHCTLYAYDIYYTAWLKAVYPEDFYIASYSVENEDEKNQLISEMMLRGYKISTPNINFSDKDIMVYKNGIFYPPLSDIKYITDKQMKEIISKREFVNFDDLFSKVKLSDRVKQSILDTCEVDDKVDVDKLISKKIKLPLLISYSNEIVNKVSEKFGIKAESIADIHSNGKTGWYLGLAVGKPRFASYGDWLPITERPTEEDIEHNPKYSMFKKYKWMSKWAKIATKDFEGRDAFVNCYPDVYEKNFEKISQIKDGSILLLKVKCKSDINARQDLIDLVVVS